MIVFVLVYHTKFELSFTFRRHFGMRKRHDEEECMFKVGEGGRNEVGEM